MIFSIVEYPTQQPALQQQGSGLKARVAVQPDVILFVLMSL